MESVTLSPKYQIVIPQAVREKLQLKAGQKFQVLAYDGRIEQVPVNPIDTTSSSARLHSETAPTIALQMLSASISAQP